MSVAALRVSTDLRLTLLGVCAWAGALLGLVVAVGGMSMVLAGDDTWSRKVVPASPESERGGAGSVGSVRSHS